MTGRKIQRKRFKRLDSLGFSEISRIYIEECQNVRELCDKIFDRLPDGRRVGCSLFYDWVDARGHRKDWGETIAFRRQLLMESIREIELNPKDEDFDWRMFQMQTRMTQSAVPWSFFSASGFLGTSPTRTRHRLRCPGPLHRLRLTAPAPELFFTESPHPRRRRCGETTGSPYLHSVTPSREKVRRSWQPSQNRSGVVPGSCGSTRLP